MIAEDNLQPHEIHSKYLHATIQCFINVFLIVFVQ